MSEERIKKGTEYHETEKYEQDIDNVEEIEGQVRFKSVNHSKRAEANEVATDGEIAEYANCALEYFGNRCAWSGERFVIFKNERETDDRINTNLSAQHILALVTGGNDVISNVVPAVENYNMQKSGYYILDWWANAKDTNGNSIYSSEKLLKLVNYVLKSEKARQDLGNELNSEEYKKRLLEPNEIDSYLSKEEITKSLLSQTITETTQMQDRKNILTQIPTKEGEILSLAEQNKKLTKISQEMFLTDAVELLENEEKIPQEIIDKLKIMTREISGGLKEKRNKLDSQEKKQSSIENGFYKNVLTNKTIKKFAKEPDVVNEKQNARESVNYLSRDEEKGIGNEISDEG